MVKTLRKALGQSHTARAPATSDESDDDQEGDDVMDLGGSSGCQQKRRMLRKNAQDRPGKLLLAGLLTMVLPAHPMKNIGEAKRKELRTLCQAFDALLKGKVESAGGLLMQQFKNHVIGLGDDSDKIGRFLELLSDEVVRVMPEETSCTWELAHKSTKADKLLS